ncbi:baseplate J/gp47 family protein [Devosia naphthalenivorans]|uniref:baseplate J/gp47 family protein n=1 Tax=Devosia naphthalenivorans TaxID=2082392 RepID=UPI000D350A6D|nr:baseplate J/gp47 family protein [Devosia naphthalenivorans]
MTRFSTDGLPRPVLVQPVNFEQAFRRRLDEFVDGMSAAGSDYDVGNLETDPAVIAAQAAGYGDTYFAAALNDAARVVLLPSFAEGTDLDLQAIRAGLGDDPRLDGESDEALRERIRLAWKGKSAAGPDDYYKSAARNFSPLVKDVAIAAETRDFSDRVLIMSVLTTENGGALSDELRDGLTVALNDPAFRSRNVTVEVVPAVISTRNVSAHIYLYPETPATVVDQAKQALIDAMAVDQRLGFDLTRSYVEKHLHRPGVQRVELQGWQNAYAEFNEAIRLGDINLTVFRVTS